MTAQLFWQIIELSKVRGHPDIRRQGKALQGHLSQLEPAEIVAFSRHFQEAMEQSYTQIMLAAATIISGTPSGPGDDTFDDFRAWLIGQGEEIFMKGTDSPDIIADLLDPKNALDATAAEGILLADSSAYAAVTGKTDHGPNAPVPHFFFGARLGPPVGDPWSVQDLPTLLPRLWEKLGVNWSGDE